jgi:Kef-type K+ transport system membrane component KefB
LTDAIHNVVALKNVACLVAFGLASFVVRLLGGSNGDSSASSVIGAETLLFLWSNAGAVALGIVTGYVLALWGSKVNEHGHGELLILLLGMILITVGGAHWLGVSTMIASMALGATLINLAPQAKHLFEVLSRTDPPVYAIFFVLAGAHLQLSSLLLIGLSGVAYTLVRIVGKIAGAWYGAVRLGYPTMVRQYLGVTLVAHAGVAIGLALQIRSNFPEYADTISAIILGSVLINEVIGPVMTNYAISHAGEARTEHAGAFEAI